LGYHQIMTDHGPSEPEAISAILRGLSADPQSRIAVGEIVARFGQRAFGALLFAFAAPNLLPLPPGSTTVLGAPLMLLCPQVALGVRAPWLPKKVEARVLTGAELARAFGRLLPWLERVERVSRPRLTGLFGPVGDRLIGVVCTLLTLVLILPIPFGNMLPALTIGVMGLALAQRDGLLAIAGYLLAGASAMVLILSAAAVVQAVRHLLIWFAGA
jgi:hypothetical protein